MGVPPRARRYPKLVKTYTKGLMLPLVHKPEHKSSLYHWVRRAGRTGHRGSTETIGQECENCFVLHRWRKAGVQPKVRIRRNAPSLNRASRTHDGLVGLHVAVKPSGKAIPLIFWNISRQLRNLPGKGKVGRAVNPDQFVDKGSDPGLSPSQRRVENDHSASFPNRFAHTGSRYFFVRRATREPRLDFSR